MRSADVLVDGFGRVREVVERTVSGLAPDQLTYRVDPEANTIAWLVWHLTRVQDDHVADVAGTEQVWTAQGWAERFGLPFDTAETGFGQTADAVGAVDVSADLLMAYHDSVHASTVAYVLTLTDDDLDKVVDTRWDPPVTLGVRLVSVIGDDLQHIGQAALIRGVVARR